LLDDLSLTQRIIDNVPLIIEHELNQKFATKLRNKLIDTIFKDSQSGRVNIEELLNEDPIIALRRKDLEDRVSQLSKIKAKLDQFWGDSLPNFDLEDNSASELPALPVEPGTTGKKKKKYVNRG
jgi:hypothetical protein